MVDAFEEAYKNIDDIDMTADKFESLDTSDPMLHLLSPPPFVERRMSTASFSLDWTRCYESSSRWGCNLCEVDDDAALGATLEGPEFGAALASS